MTSVRAEDHQTIRNIVVVLMVMEDSKVWKENFRKLKAYHQKYGTFNVPSDGKDKLLSRWIENIRKHPERLTAKLSTGSSVSCFG